MPNPNIERFTSWEEIFPDPTEAERQYADFLAGMKADYSDKTLQTTEIDPETGLTVTTFEGNGVHSKVQRLANGNVRMDFSSGNITEITPEVGNKAHEWTCEGVTSLARGMRQLYDSTTEAKSKLGLYMVVFYLKGKPATQGWEDTFLYNNAFPQRIGYMLYPDNALKDAQRHLAQRTPLSN